MDAKKIIILLAICFRLLAGQQIEISGDNFFADEKALYADLKGNVIIKKGSFDRLTSNNAKIIFNSKKEPIKYIVSGNAKFQAIVNQKKYDGSGDELTYESNSKIYTIRGNAYLHEIDTDKKVYGEEIVFNQENGTYRVSSLDKKPVRFLFEINQK